MKREKISRNAASASRRTNSLAQGAAYGIGKGFKNEMTVKLIALILTILLGLSQHSFSNKIISTHDILSDTLRIKNDLEIITKTTDSRNYKNVETLNFVADYIFDELSKNCDTVYFQPYLVNGIEYKNVIGSIGTDKPERIQEYELSSND